MSNRSDNPNALNTIGIFIEDAEMICIQEDDRAGIIFKHLVRSIQSIEDGTGEVYTDGLTEMEQMILRRALDGSLRHRDYSRNIKLGRLYGGFVNAWNTAKVANHIIDPTPTREEWEKAGCPATYTEWRIKQTHARIQDTEAEQTPANDLLTDDDLLSFARSKRDY